MAFNVASACVCTLMYILVQIVFKNIICRKWKLVSSLMLSQGIGMRCVHFYFGMDTSVAAVTLMLISNDFVPIHVRVCVIFRSSLGYYVPMIVTCSAYLFFLSVLFL